MKLLALMILACQLFVSEANGASHLRIQEGTEQHLIELNGKFYQVHTVARGESLYGISKRYGVSLGELAVCNPDVYYGIKVGQKLLIPTQKPSRERSDTGFSLHMVQEGETLYSIARQYGVTVAALRSYNGLTSDGLTKDSILRIPVAHGGEQSASGGGEALHVVQEGETLYSIARQHGVAVDALRNYNGLTSDELTIKGVLRIPAVESSEQTVVKGTAEVWHAVRSGETLHSLAKRYGSSVDLIKQKNALTSDALSVGQVLCIPLSGSIEAKDSCEARHVVQRGESLYHIAKSYGVPLMRLARANPAAIERGLQAGDELCIPRLASAEAPSSTAEPQLGAGNINRSDLRSLFEPPRICDSIAGYPKGRTLRCALLLPFCLESVSKDSLKVSVAVKNAIAGDRAVSFDDRFLPFYQGALLALEQFKRSGYKVALNVFDTRNSAERVRRIVASDTLSGADIIIGPVFPQNVAIVSEYAASRRITMVSPLSGVTPSFELNPFLFQTNPSYRTQLRQIANSIELSDSTNVLLVREDAGKEESVGQTLHLMLEGRIASLPDGSAARYSVMDCSLAEVSKMTSRQIAAQLLPDRRNIVILASSSEPLVNALLGQLAGVTLLKKFRIEVYGMPQWLKMDKLDFGHLLSLNTRVFSPYYVDYEDSRVCNFVSQYRETYLEEPSQYSFQGYDVVVYFLRALFKFGIDFRYCIDWVEDWQLQNVFRFRQSQDFGTYENEGMFVLRFDKERGLVRER